MRNFGIDLIKGIAVSSVIISHTSFFKNISPVFFIGFEMPFFIIISGITHMLSLKNRSYSIENHIEQMIRILIPAFLPICAFIIFLGTYTSTVGSFFIPLLIQLTLIFPLLFFTYKRNKHGTIILFFLLDLGFESIAPVLPYEIYRACILRYLFSVVLGMYLGDTITDKISNSSQKPILIIGIIGACILSVGIYSFLPFRPEWIVQNPLTFGYAAMITAFAIRMPVMKLKVLSIIAAIGKHSYYIYIIQMLFFVVVFPFLLVNDIPSHLIVIFAIVFCIVIGGVYKYILDNLITLLKQYIETFISPPTHTLSMATVIECPKCKAKDVRYRKTDGMTWCRKCGHEWKEDKK